MELGGPSISIVEDHDHDHDHDHEAEVYQLQWAAIERLPTVRRLRTSLVNIINGGTDDQEQKEAGDHEGKRVTDVTKLGAVQRQLFIHNLINHIENDNLKLLRNVRDRIDRVNVKLPTVEIRYKNLCVEAECEIVEGKPLPTLWNSIVTSFSVVARLMRIKSHRAKMSILKDVSGVIKPSRLTLLLGPPGCGKTTLLLALSGILDRSLKVRGEISYNGYNLDEFIPQRTSAYISQYDLHIPEMTVRETIDFSARCQGVGSRADMMMEVIRREKEAGIVPDPDVDTYMKAISAQGQRSNMQTDYVLKILGLNACADTIVGNALRRGISGGQRKRLTTGEMIVGPIKALLMDEISTGLDSSTTFQIVTCLQQLVHITDTTALVSLLQPAPETFNLFDDLILMAEGKILYQGPRTEVLQYFEDCGFKCLERKGVADFLQEVISKKDQAQYWYRTGIPYKYVSVDQFSEMFKVSNLGQNLNQELSTPYDKTLSHKSSISFKKYSLSKRELFKACMARELLLMKQNSFVYIFKTLQLIIVAVITMTVFIRTEMNVDLVSANYLMGAMFYTLVRLMLNGTAELIMTLIRLPVIYKQKAFCMYPAWAYSIPASILKIPLSLADAIVWTSLTYYVIGYSPGLERFLAQLLVLFALHLASTSLCRFIAVIFRTVVVATTVGMVLLLLMFIFGGFIIPQPSLPAWLRWGFWLSLTTYGEIGVSLNEFRDPRWKKTVEGNTTIGNAILTSHGLDFDGSFYWVSVGALLGFTLLFDFGFTLALTYLEAPKMSRSIVSKHKLSRTLTKNEGTNLTYVDEDSVIQPHTTQHPSEIRKMALPFQPLSVAFKDVQYSVDTPAEMRKHGFKEKKLQLLQNISGAFRPGILTALMGVSGAGKTTLLDVLSGRKSAGTFEGDIRIGGYPKVQKTFARISGYCEQNDIHSPQITVEESIMFSAWLRLPPETDELTRQRFVQEVIETIELDDIKDSLVGIPGRSGLSIEQRKRLTIAVELVSNPSVIFMDEPTSGLDARAAAIVMRAVKNVVSTGRTVVCTIHQPSIHVFEAFDELILLKTGGKVIYSGSLGHHSSELIAYFESIPGVPKIEDNYNPATWMLEVTSASMEAELGLDFATIFQDSSLYKNTVDLVEQLSQPEPGSKDLHFSTTFPQSGWVQFKACLWKQSLSYWRSPEYNLTRFIFVIIASMLFGVVFWQRAQKIHNEQDLFSILGAMYMAVIFLGTNNGSIVLPYVATERAVLYRERFAGMYSSWAYTLAQVTIEIPYVMLQAIMFTAITYPAIGYYWSVSKVFWYLYISFCTFLYFVYLGMLLMAVSSALEVASILSAAVYTLLNLFSGYLIPGPKIPKWWIWCYWICPSSWSLNGLLTSQFGDVETEISIFGEPRKVDSFLRSFYGFHHDRLPLVAVVLMAFPVIFASLFAYYVGKLNFQRR